MKKIARNKVISGSFEEAEIVQLVRKL